MIVECWAIIILILLVSYMIFRTGKAGQAVAVLPLVTVPVFHLLGIPLSRLLQPVMAVILVDILHISFDVVGLVIACVLYGLLEANMGSRRGRRMYMILCGTFTALLTIVLVQHILVR